MYYICTLILKPPVTKLKPSLVLGNYQFRKVVNVVGVFWCFVWVFKAGK